MKSYGNVVKLVETENFLEKNASADVPVLEQAGVGGVWRLWEKEGEEVGKWKKGDGFAR